MTDQPRYKIEGGPKRGYAVVEENGGIEYDLLGTRALARAICDILNDGIDPRWDSVSAELKRRGISARHGGKLRGRKERVPRHR